MDSDRPTVAEHGLVLGKFMPPHRGHLSLLDFARHFTSDLTIVVGSLPSEPIPGGRRVEWIRALYPGVRVVHLTDENPQYPEEHPDFWEIWRRSLQRVAERPVRYLFASEAYGKQLAQVLDAVFVPTPGGRSRISVSGTEIRRQPARFWEFLPAVVRPDFVKRIAVLGTRPELRSALAARLAKELLGAVMLEPYEHEDRETAWQGQLAAEGARIRGEHAVLVSDAAAASHLLLSDGDPCRLLAGYHLVAIPEEEGAQWRERLQGSGLPCLVGSSNLRVPLEQQGFELQ